MSGRELIQCERVTLAAAAAGLHCRSHYIFHTGHVGSTLISRLIGEHRNFFSLREPSLLRSLADRSHASTAPLELAALLSLFSRRWRADQLPVLKVTSFVSELADSIMTEDPEGRAVFMFAQPLAYLRGILAGETSRIETKLMAGARLRRLTARVSAQWDLATMSEGEWVAMSWLCEMTALHVAANQHAQQILWVDFDQFLDSPAQLLLAIMQKLGADPSPTEIAALLASAVMRQYSKGPEHAYDAALRRDVLRSADLKHGREIQRGLDWLQKAAATNEKIKTLFEAR